MVLHMEQFSQIPLKNRRAAKIAIFEIHAG